jgi:hypothetical protein
MTTATPRGLRNSNPGNIRHGQKWQGLAAVQSDPDFATFKSPAWGIRAIARTLLTYHSAHRCNTIRKIIERWAPPNENNTSAYVAAVARRVGVGENVTLDVDSVEVMLPLVKAIIQHENGQNPYSDAQILEGLHMAGVSDAAPKPLVKQPGFQAQALAAVATTGAVCAQYAEPVKKAADQLAGFTGSPIISHVYTVLLTIAGIATLAGLIAAFAKQHATR